MTVALTCDRCGATMPRKGGAEAVAVHQASGLCAAGAARRQAEADGLLGVLHFDLLMNWTMAKSIDEVAADRVKLLHAGGVRVERRLTKVEQSVIIHDGGFVTANKVFVAAPEPWAPAWAVAVAWPGMSCTKAAAAVLRRGLTDADLRAAIMSVVRIDLSSSRPAALYDDVQAIIAGVVPS